jgi:drug/metabolite transporter (DMT)-like permease
VIDGRRWASVVLAFGGVCIVVAGSGLEAGRLDWADTLAILAGLAQAATNLLFRHAKEVPLCCKNAAMFWAAPAPRGASCS